MSLRPASRAPRFSSCLCLLLHSPTPQQPLPGLHTCMPIHSVVSYSLRSQGLQPARLLCPWGFSRQEYQMCFHVLLQWISPTQGLNLSLPCLLALAGVIFPTEPPGKPLPRSADRSAARPALPGTSFSKTQETVDALAQCSGAV